MPQKISRQNKHDLNVSIEISVNELHALDVVTLDSFCRITKKLRPLLC